MDRCKLQPARLPTLQCCSPNSEMVKMLLCLASELHSNKKTTEKYNKKRGGIYLYLVNKLIYQINLRDNYGVFELTTIASTDSRTSSERIPNRVLVRKVILEVPVH